MNIYRTTISKSEVTDMFIVEREMKRGEGDWRRIDGYRTFDLRLPVKHCYWKPDFRKMITPSDDDLWRRYISELELEV